MFTRMPIVCAVAVFFIALSARADDAELKKAVKVKAEEIQGLLIKKEFDKFADMTHPKIVEGMGGKEKMVARLTTESKKMKDSGIEFKSAKLLDPADPIRADKDIYVSIPFTLEMSAPGGRLVAKSMLIGISSDNGKSWAFVDANPGRDTIKKVFPNLPEAIVFPKKEMPTFIKD